MPCDTIQTVSVVLKVADLDLLTAALKALGYGTPQRQGEIVFFGYQESYNKATNELRIRNQENAAKIKQAYSAEIVKQQAKRYGWQIKETAQFQYEIVKR